MTPLETRLRSVLAAEAAAVAPLPVLPPFPRHQRPGRWARFQAWRAHRRHLPVSRSGVIAAYLLGNAILAEVPLLLMARYGVHIDWARFATTWKP